MGIIGKIIGSSTATNKDSGTDVLLLEVELSEPGDNQQAENFRLSGIDCNPPKGSHVLVEEAGAFLIVAGVHDEIEQESGEGEIEIYSSADGSKQAKVKCKSSGDVVVNDGAFPAARQNHQTLVDGTTDTVMIAWMTAVSSALTSLGVTISPPTTITGKINEGESTVKIP